MHELLLLLGFKFSLDIYVIFLNFMGLSFESFHIELWPSTRPLPESIVGLSPSVLPEYSPAARGDVSCVSPEGLLGQSGHLIRFHSHPGQTPSPARDGVTCPMARVRHKMYWAAPGSPGSCWGQVTSWWQALHAHTSTAVPSLAGLNLPTQGWILCVQSLKSSWENEGTRFCA